MRNLLTLALLAAACTKQVTPVTDSAAAEAIAARLCTLSEKTSTPCEYKGQEAKVAEHTVKVNAFVQQDLSGAGTNTIDLKYELNIDGVDYPQLASTMVANGPSRNDAIEKAASDWASMYGAAILDYLANSGRMQTVQAIQDDQIAKEAFKAGEWKAYAGWLYQLGSPKEKSVIMVEELVTKLQPIVDQWTDKGPHAVLISLNLRHGYAPEGECTLDGIPSDEICEAAMTYNWPEPGAYIVKQYFIFTK